jgi:hypothetical protein
VIHQPDAAVLSHLDFSLLYFWLLLLRRIDAAMAVPSIWSPRAVAFREPWDAAPLAALVDLD